MSELKDQLKNVNERVDELVNNPSELTKDALLGQLRNFYDSVKKMEFETVAVPAPKETKPKAALAPKVAAAPIPAPVPKEESAPEKIAEPVVAKEEKPVVEEKKAGKPVVEEVTAEEEKPKAKKEPMIGKEEPVSEDGDKKILAGQFNKTPLSDLRSGIPLNEKFGIIRTLFKGNASDFGDAVLKLNNAANAKEMEHYMGLLKQRFAWDEATEAYQNFVGYVERRKLSMEPSNADAD